MNFDEYLKQFEEKIICTGVKNGCLGKKERVPVRPDRLEKSNFGKLLGVHVQSEDILVIDYYGFWKKSEGFGKELEVLSNKRNYQVKSIEANVVHFASIRIEKIAELAPELVSQFPWFKKEILTARGFRHEFNF